MALTLPDARFADANEALEVYYQAGFQPILIHAPKHAGISKKCSCGKDHDACGKHPIAASWQKPASLDELRQHRARLTFEPNVGIVLGEQQNHEYLIAIDVDVESRFRELEKELGPLPETVRGESGRGSRLLFEYPKDLPTSHLKNITGLTPHSAEDPDRKNILGVDVKVKGGQVVVAPSRHFNGKKYTWTRSGTIETLPMSWALEIAPQENEVPKWVSEFTPQSIRDDAKAKKRAESYLERAVMRDAASIAACGKGMRNSLLHKRSVALFALCGGLYLGWRWGYVTEQLRRAGVASGLPAREVERTLTSAEKHVREKGLLRVPVALADPVTSSSLPSLPPPPDSLPDATATRVPLPGESTDKRPTIQIGVELHENADASTKSLLADADVYQRAGELVHVTRASGNETIVAVEGTPQIRGMALATLRERMTRVARFEAHTEKHGWRRSMPTDNLVSAVLNRKQWEGIPSILGVIETPTMRPDGTILQEPGYDKSTGYVYIPNDSFGKVEESPSKSEAERAYRFITDIFSDFPYVKKSHRSVPLAAILTIVARAAITGAVPAFLFDASTRGSGKTLQTDVISMVATGRGMPRMNYPVKEEELEKVLGAYVLRGAPFFCFDNVTRTFGGGPLELLLTAKDTVQLRVLGRSEVPTLPWRSVVLATGNNISLFSDTARRVVVARLEPDDEQPELRSDFRHPNLVEWVKTNRKRLVAASLTLLRAYVVAGRPSFNRPWGSFEEWSQLIPQAIVFAGGENPMEARPAADSDLDTHSAALRCLLRDLPLLFKQTNEFRTSDVIHVLFRAAREEKDPWADLREAIETLCSPKDGSDPTSVALGRRLMAAKGRVLDGKRLVSRPGPGGSVRWSVSDVNHPNSELT